MTVSADDLIAEHGEQAYYKAVVLTAAATIAEDLKAAAAFAAATRELMMRGYHKFEKAS